MPQPSTAAVSLDENDRQLLRELQTAVPLAPRPFAVLGAQLGLSEDAVLERVTRLKDERIIRQISAIFDTGALGYRSTLVASAVPEDRVPVAAQVINDHPGVSHNYRRTHDFNLWWTLAVPPDEDLAAHVGALHRRSGATASRMLPATVRYKLGVHLDVAGDRAPDARTSPQATTGGGPAPERADLSAAEIAHVRELQQDLPVEPAPFAAMAERLGTAERDVLERARVFLEDGTMRRFAAVLHHRRAGFGANAMSVWRAPLADIDAQGHRLARFAAVSHCYRRPTYPDWPYPLFAMLHATTPEGIDEAVAAIRADTGLEEPRLLYSTEELKKVRITYFDPAFTQWARAHVRPGDTLDGPEPIA